MFKQLIYFLFLLFLPVAQAWPHPSSEEDRSGLPNTKELSSSAQRKFDYFFYEGINLKNAGKYDAAFDAFNYCYAIDSTAAPVLYELANFYMQLNHPEIAVGLLKKAVESSFDNFSYKIALASITRSLGMLGEAAKAYEELVKEYPEKADLNFYLAEALTQQGDIQKAIETYNALETSMGMNEALSMQKYRLYNMLGEPDRALEEIGKLANKYPMESRYQIILGDLHLDKGETDKALEFYEKAYTIDPTSPYYIVSMANYYEIKGDKEAAETQIRNALINEKLDVDTKVNILSRYIVSLQQSQKDTESANPLFETLLEQHPEDIELRQMYGGLLTIQGKMDEAKFQFQLITEMEPENMAAWQQLLNLSVRDVSEMIRISKKCIELFPDVPQYYLWLGLAYFQDENYQGALQAYREGIEVTTDENLPLKSDFYGQIGDTYYYLNQMEQAYAAYDEALKYNERNVVVLNNYAYFLALAKKDLVKAERMSALCIKLEPDNATYLDTYAWIFFMQGNYTLAKFYIEKALTSDRTGSDELVDHYGDILFMSGDVEKAVEQWIKAKEMGKESPVLDQKIAERKYIEDENVK